MEIRNAREASQAIHNIFKLIGGRRLLDQGDPRRDIDEECGYPLVITKEDYRRYYDRHGIASAVVDIYPNETWRDDPTISENEDATGDRTAFEKRWDELTDEDGVNAYHYLERIDRLSGIGSFGCLLIGTDDGRKLEEPIEGIDEKGNPTTPPQNRELLYLRAFDESLVQIVGWNNYPTNHRFAQPEFYNLSLVNTEAEAQTNDLRSVQDQQAGLQLEQVKVHWSRILHVADNRTTSEVLGVPRMQCVWDRLYDLRKIMGGGGEMFWRGAFPGVSMETHPVTGEEVLEVDIDSIRDQLEQYMNSLQRYLVTEGVTAKSLAPQVADPTAHFMAQLKFIAATIRVPLRVFLGSEEARLASDQDTKAFNGRINRRRLRYVNPMLLRPFVSRLMIMGVLPTVEKYFVTWPDPNAPSRMDNAEYAHKVIEALARYVAVPGVDELITPESVYTHLLGFDQTLATAFLEAVAEQQSLVDDGDLEDDLEDDSTPPSPDEDEDDLDTEGEDDGEGDGTAAA